MKLKVWSKAEAKKSEEGQLFIKLHQHEECCNDISLIVVDADGQMINSGNLMILESKLNCLIMLDNINPIVPLKTDIDGALMFMCEEEYNERRKKKEIIDSLTFKISEIAEREKQHSGATH